MEQIAETQAVVPIIDRTDGRLDAAVLAYRADPSESNREALMLLAAEHHAHFVAEQSEEFVIRTSEPVPVEPAASAPDLVFAKGARVVVADEAGVWVVAGHNKDGSLTCYPTGERGGARVFLPAWCLPAERIGRGGKKVSVRSVPAEMRRARAEWRAQHGFPPLRSADLQEVDTSDDSEHAAQLVRDVASRSGS